MAREYDASKEERKELLEIKKNNRGDYIRVAQIKNTSSGVESLDVRNFYTNDEDEICPTSKGIRISSDYAFDVIKAMVNILESNELMDLQDEIERIVDERIGDSEDSEEMTTQGDD